MLLKAKYLELHSMFYDLFVSLPASQAEYLPYDCCKIPVDIAKGIQWFIFHSMAQDFLRELINEINQFLTDIRRLDAWSRVKEQCPEEYKFDFIVEIFDPIASNTINGVYIVLQRFIYISSMLLHQTKMLIDTDWKENNLDESRINVKTLEGLKGSFITLKDLINNVKEIVSPEFLKITRNFRNLYHHRVPPNIELGISSFVNRRNDGKGNICYRLGGKQPVKIDNILLSLYKQHQVCSNSFSTFWNLIGEQLDIWKRETSNST